MIFVVLLKETTNILAHLPMLTLKILWKDYLVYFLIYKLSNSDLLLSLEILSLFDFNAWIFVANSFIVSYFLM